MPIRIRLRNIDEIDSLLELLKNDCANDYRRTWSLDDRTIAVLIYERLGLVGGYSFTVMTIVDYFIEEQICEIHIRYVGGNFSFLGTGKSEDFIKEITSSIEDLAKEKLWNFEVEKIKIRNAGSQCPNCRAAYKYLKENVRENGTVECQNCGKPFILQDVT